MRNVPFFANTIDDTHCVQACLKMILKYFLPERDFSWAELDKMTHKLPGKGTWRFPVSIELQKLGLKTKDIETFDYKRYMKEEKSYIIETYGHEVGNWYLKNSNLTDVKQFIPEYLKKSIRQVRSANLDDIDTLLAGDWLIVIDVNSRTLNKQPGFSSHMVVVFGKKDSDYCVHDPGLPPYPNRRVPSNLFLKAWQYSGTNSTNLTAVGH